MNIDFDRIERIDLQPLVGMTKEMSIIDNKTSELWMEFGPRIKEIQDRVDNDRISAEEYPAEYFTRFSPTKIFVKWAAVRVSDGSSPPEGLSSLEIPGGTYAVFNYHGLQSDAMQAYGYIYGRWIPESSFKLDDRPHFAIMGDDYRMDDPQSKEEIWIPIKEVEE